MEVVGGSIPLATTKLLTDVTSCGSEPIPMLQFVVAILLLTFIF